MAALLLEERRQQVIDIAVRAADEKLIQLTMGNFSLRDVATGYILITPSGMSYHTLVPADIVVVAADGRIVDGARRPSVETPIHCAIYRCRPDAGGVAHTHSAFATAWACCNQAIPPVVAELAALVGGAVECAPYQPSGSPELAAVVSEGLRHADAVLMANHGMVALGADLPSAYANAVMVEEGAKVAFYARQIGNPQIISRQECESLRRMTLEKYGQR